MQYLKQLLSFIFSRATFAFVGVVVLALVIWFVGPYLAVDGLRPLAATGVRVSLLVLLLASAILWLASAPVSLAIVAAVCLMIWHAGPLVSLGAAHPLEPIWLRVSVVAAILFLCAAYWAHRLWKLVKSDPQALTRFFSDDNTAQSENREQLKNVSGAINRAVAQLKTLRSGGGLKRIFEGKRYLYELPWYMIVGSPGAGKTTALLNSGLQFPLARQMMGAARSTTFAAPEGTLHCDWWLSNEAVLIDTAGRYTTQNSNPANDAIEWRGFLGLLRKHRTRAPINGAIVALSAEELRNMSAQQRADHAGIVRDRLAELRQELGIRFPIYVVVTKADLLRGFSEYFQALTSEGRTQAWGFALPHEGLKGGRRSSAADIAARRTAMREQLGTHFTALKERLEAGSRARLTEEFDVERRHQLQALPQEFQALTQPLLQVLDDIFLDSRFDDTQLHSTLRGVYFTSAAQADGDIPGHADTLVRRLWKSIGAMARTGKAPVATLKAPADVTDKEAKKSSGAEPDAAPDKGEVDDAETETVEDAHAHSSPALRADTPMRSYQGYFLQDFFSKVVFAEAHLVRPNLRWEFRFRLMRLMGHTLAVVLFIWLAAALALSHRNNEEYLETVSDRTHSLKLHTAKLFAKFKPADVPEILGSVRELPGYAGLDLTDPPASFLYGLYSAPEVLRASRESYAQLQDHTLLPSVLARMEAVLAQSVRERNATTAYETLRVYKLLHDKAHYMKDGGARDVRNWVLKDWESNDSASVFGGRASMVGHVESLFSGDRLVQSSALPNETLVREVQSFLDGNTSTQRVYERAKAAMLLEAPQEFTLVRAVGPQAGTVFARAGGLPLEKGVPGLFTYDGYHDLFNKRLPEFVARALDDDAWVMGRVASAKPNIPAEAAAQLRNNPLLEDVRRQYLNEYAAHWDEFLGSIRTVAAGDIGGGNLGFDLSVLRQFAAPDSPLTRLARAAARETTLSRPLITRIADEKSLLDKASDELNKQTREIGKNLGIRPEERLEKQLVDNRFAALREVVTGQVDGMAGSSMGGVTGAKSGLEAISGLLNEFYTLLVVADTALTAGSLPPGGAEVGTRLKLEAGKLPAPFREVLIALAGSGSDKVAAGSSAILRAQAQLQLDRLTGLMAMQVSEPCRRGIEGRYPFAATGQDAAIEDVTQVFASGGAMDEYFNKYLAPFVDTSVRPWRYKDASTANAMVGAEALTAGAQGAATPVPATAGPTLLGELLKLLAQGGPNLETFHRARQIRELFFRDAGGKKLAWKMDMKVLELDPTITDLVIDIDGQGQRYIHGPEQSFTVHWPGPRGGATAQFIANPKVSGATSTVMFTGPWSLFRLVDKGRIMNTATPGRTSVEYTFDGRKALIDLSAGSQPNPFNSDLLKGFRCPGRAA